MMQTDFIDAISFGYREVWRERAYLMKLAFVPIMIKFASTVVVYSFDMEDNFIRQGLVALPGLFAEGWLLAQFLRTLLMQERWPIYLEEPPSDQKMAALLLRARGIMSSAILYALISFLAYGMKQVMFYFMPADDAADKTAAQDPNPLLFIPAVALIYLSIWIFRFMWLYIPVAVLMPMGDFLKKLGGFMASIKMIGIFLVTLVPCLFVAITLSKIFGTIVGGVDTAQGSFIALIIHVIMETIIGLISTASMAYALRNIVPHHPAALKDINHEN
jgi:hypothetical protein